jgi:hypothetical protein
MRERRIATLFVVAGLLVPACAEASGAEDGSDLVPPARLEEIEGSDIGRVVLTSEASHRLGLETTPVRTGPGPDQTVIPHAAIFYGLTGETWTYTSPEALTYVREPVSVQRIDGDVAYLEDGPPPGTQVVTVGAAELYGVETGVGD